MTIKIDLSAKQTKDVREENLARKQVIVDAAVAGTIAATRFVFLAAFDGTNNDKDAPPAGEQSTNVGQLWDQFVAASGPQSANQGGKYHPGPGTPGTLTHSSWLPDSVQQQVILAAEDAYRDFAVQAADWLDDHPGGAVTAVVVAFSRGCASAAIFSQMVWERGLVNPRAPTTLLVSRGAVGIAAGVLFDPVMTGVNCNLAFPPDARAIIAIKALNEYRYLFAGADYSNQGDVVTTVGMYGNHCDIGGGYDNGIGAISLAAATGYLQKSGLSIAAVPAVRRHVAKQVCVHSEEFDNYGKKIWDVYNSAGFSYEDRRLLLPVATPLQANLAAGKGVFTLYSGKTMSVALPPPG